MVYDFDQEINRKLTNDLKWRSGGLKGYMPICPSDNMIPMWIADMDFSCPPCVIRAIEKRTANGIFGYCAPQTDYFQALYWWYKNRLQLEVSEKIVTIMPTVVSAINMGIRTFSYPGDQVIIQQPVYDPFAEIIEKTGRKLVNNALLCRDGRYYMDYELLEKQTAHPKAKILILCSPHNPVGRVWDWSELEQLGNICKRNGVFVISDEIHSDIIFKGNKHTPFSLVCDAPHMVCTAPGKTFNVAGLRIANIFISNPEHKQLYDKTADEYSMKGVNTFGLEAVTAAYSLEGAEWLEALLEYLEENIKIVESWASNHGIGYIKQQGTFLCWLDFQKTGWKDSELQKKVIEEEEVICAQGPWFGAGGEMHLRLNIGCTRKTLEEALNRIGKVL